MNEWTQISTDWFFAPEKKKCFNGKSTELLELGTCEYNKQLKAQKMLILKSDFCSEHVLIFSKMIPPPWMKQYCWGLSHTNIKPVKTQLPYLSLNHVNDCSILQGPI